MYKFEKNGIEIGFYKKISKSTDLNDFSLLQGSRRQQGRQFGVSQCIESFNSDLNYVWMVIIVQCQRKVDVISVVSDVHVVRDRWGRQRGATAAPRGGCRHSIGATELAFHLKIMRTITITIWVRYYCETFEEATEAAFDVAATTKQPRK